MVKTGDRGKKLNKMEYRFYPAMRDDLMSDDVRCSKLKTDKED